MDLIYQVEKIVEGDGMFLFVWKECVLCCKGVCVLREYSRTAGPYVHSRGVRCGKGYI